VASFTLLDVFGVRERDVVRKRCVEAANDVVLVFGARTKSDRAVSNRERKRICDERCLGRD
jgi:hypothetical protein